MIDDKNREKMIKKEILLQLQNEIEDIDNKIKNIKLVNTKTMVVRNLKISLKALQLVAPYVLTATITTGLYSITVGVPFVKNDGKLYLNSITAIYNNGEISKSYFYSDKQEDAIFVYHYNKWLENNDGTYYRNVDIYSIANISYDEVVTLIRIIIFLKIK